MEEMKRISIILTFVFVTLCSTAAVSYAQDARQRAVSTIVQDVLAQMPVQTKTEFNNEFKDLAASAPQSVTMLAGMLKSAGSSTNDVVEDALNGLTNFVTDPANASYLKNVKKGFEEAAAACPDKYNKAFLLTQLRLLDPENNLVAQPEPKSAEELLSEYKSLAKSDKANLRCQAVWDLVDAKGPESAKALVKALKDPDRSVRATALNAAATFADDSFLSMVSKKYKSLSDEAKADVVNWAGDNKYSGLEGLVLNALDSDDKSLAEIAAYAASKFGTDATADALLSKVGSGNVPEDILFDALRATKADINGKVCDALKSSDGERLCSLMKLASSKRMKDASATIFNIIATKDGSVRNAALDALSGVVCDKDVPFLATALNNAAKDTAPQLEKAFKAAIAPKSGADQYSIVSDIISKVNNPDRFYSALAQSATDQAVNDLAAKAEKGSKSALAALASIKNYKAYKPLFNAARNDASLIPAVVSLVKKYEKDIDNKSSRLISALEMAPADMKGSILGDLASVPTMESFLGAAKYLDDGNLSYTAAQTVKSIASKCEDDIDYNDFVNNMTKARDIFAKSEDADDGYAVDEINKMLSEAVPAQKTSMTEEERLQNFEVLFDGTDMSAWEGNLKDYTPVNGTIYVSAHYGNDLNLYTKKEYRDFILRFEFCFTRPGVNNGIGVRTPEGVDAAYDGMCEVQVLDHDDPIYAGLREYQVHGSVYGIVPAKRIVHKPLGEWSEEEIKVVGDHITVTVNGDVIVDADVREACQGYNVAPDGSDYNPYTVDHHNHPGLFNEKGHISFCGHGVGMRYRNVRVLDLSAQKAAKKSSGKSRKK